VKSAQKAPLFVSQDPGILFLATADPEALFVQSGLKGLPAVRSLPGGRDGLLQCRQIVAQTLGCLVLIGRERGVRQIILSDACLFQLLSDLKTAFAPQSLDHSLVVAARCDRMAELNFRDPRDLLLSCVRMRGTHATACECVHLRHQDMPMTIMGLTISAGLLMLNDSGLSGIKLELGRQLLKDF